MVGLYHTLTKKSIVNVCFLLFSRNELFYRSEETYLGGHYLLVDQCELVFAFFD